MACIIRPPVLAFARFKNGTMAPPTGIAFPLEYVAWLSDKSGHDDRRNIDDACKVAIGFRVARAIQVVHFQSGEY